VGEESKELDKQGNDSGEIEGGSFFFEPLPKVNNDCGGGGCMLRCMLEEMEGSFNMGLSKDDL
jgi:hypothetical protein